MIKIAVCDDEKTVHAQIQASLADICPQLNLEYELECFFSTDALCRALEGRARFDLIYLDIMFPEHQTGGVQIGRLIRDVHRNNSTSIVFISWKREYAEELFKIRPMYFLIKPLRREDIEYTIKTWLEVLESYGGGGNLLYSRLYRTQRADKGYCLSGSPRT